MWILKSLEPGGDTHYLLPDKEYVVGRKNCDFLIPNDQSISRVHAHLIVTDQTLALSDSSKYGTSVNNQRLADNQTLKLKSGDNVTFGVFQSKFSVDFEKVVVCSSCLDNNAKMLLSQALLPLGGKLVNAWTKECTHLVMPSVKVTIKTICALLCCQPIIKQEFFTEFSKAMQQKSLPPKAENFIPEIDEPSLNEEEVDLRANQKRKQLFAGKTFLFLSTKQLKRLTIAVSFGGGRSQLLEEGSLPRYLLESPQSCVIDIATANSQIPHPASNTEWANSVRLILQEKGLRFITESEIGLAAIYASCEKYCNPSNPLTDSDSVQRVRPRISSATLSQNAVEETVLPAASQNVTVYVANTEASQVLTVGETMSSSFNTVEDTALQMKKPKPSFQDKKKDNTRLLTSPKGKGGTKMSPQKQKLSTQTSPQKQSTLTSFFQPVNKKRPREEESYALQSDPKRTLPPTSITAPPQKKSHIPKQIPSKKNSVKSTTGRTQSQSGSGNDLYTGCSEVLSDGVSHPAQQGVQGRKRKEMEELESLMSEDTAFPDWVSHPAKQGEQNKKKKEMEEIESIMSEDMDLPGQISHHAMKREQERKETVEGLHMEELESIMSEDIALPDGVSHPAKEGEQGRGRKEMEERIHMEELESMMSEDMALPDGVFLSVPQEAQGRKQKDIKTEIQMEELESIMSEDMDCLDINPLASHVQKTNQNVAKGSSDQKQQLNSVKHSSMQKRLRADPEENNSNQRPSVSLDKGSISNTKQSLKMRKHTSTEKQQPCPSEQATANQRLSKFSEKGPPAKKNQDDSELFCRDVSQPVEVKETTLKPNVVTQDAPMTEAEVHLPRRLVVVEFKSLTITAPPRNKQQEKQSNSFTKNFKHFCKVRVPGTVGAPQAIGLTKLMAYSRGRNSELEEWFKETAEDERQSREEESLGDDLFRYNPTKITKRR